MYDKSKALPLDEDGQHKETEHKPLTEVKIYDSQTGFEEKKPQEEGEGEDAQITALAEQTVKMAEAF